MLRGCWRSTSANCCGPIGPSGTGATVTDPLCSGGSSTQLARPSGRPLGRRADSTSSEPTDAGSGADRWIITRSSVIEVLVVIP